ncbi:MAG TPA: hypothetical protein VMQ17_26770 [Candidatus Sulfotelmatobacter sp.]|nr:hypothetical protein [Candidatus Sulfotelmatobacter sp.]
MACSTVQTAGHNDTDADRWRRAGEDEAAKYRSDAKASALLWPRTLTVLGRTAAGYEADPEREDQSAEQRDWGTEW